MFELIVIVAAVGGALWAVAAYRLRGADMSAFDQPTGERFSRGDTPGPEIGAVITSLGGLQGVLKGVPMRQHNTVLRKYMDQSFADRVLDVQIAPVNSGGVRDRSTRGGPVVQSNANIGLWHYVELDGSHWLMFTHPDEVAEIILG